MSADIAFIPRSYLFVPGDRPERFGKAFGAGADAVVVDLEDAVAPDRKDAARAALAAWRAAGQERGGRLVVRVNDDASPWFADDLDMLRTLGPCEVMLPKAESARQLERLAAALPAGTGVIALIESARGVLAAEAVAAAPGVARLAFGTLDYALDLGLDDDPRGLLYPASRIALASRAAGLPPPVAGVTAGFNDDAALREDFGLARACGFGAKLCVHPRQVAPVHAMLAPSAEQRDWAARVVAAAGAGGGAVQVDGKMVDRPVLVRANAILARGPA
ncbi:HpcH/HpaI aldolase/citrate lyase family protein [Pseudoduganella namucuonensis]|uniref:Citrate lyase subunit beta / citryl-CoA lyase n=1 Tax=Pseudoduganella namucuonensis TaxID=1035707 RepID=A0A1I7M064_9BURK|nr:CoA ester lyase [Pseudoduganella namucuonensis]SFV15190.1 citrate lyase subunit beta / citryl-CoA lyase [Pseudoduganella namucuonensis]